MNRCQTLLSALLLCPAVSASSLPREPSVPHVHPSTWKPSEENAPGHLLPASGVLHTCNECAGAQSWLRAPWAGLEMNPQLLILDLWLLVILS